jgi:hypothetical protein
MSLTDLVATIAQRLDAAGIPYMLTGSLASSFHGEPRSTRDADMVIDPTPDALRRFVTALAEAEGSYLDADAALDALEQRSKFNVIEVATGWKVDFILRKDRPFSVEEFKRRQRVDLPGGTTYVATAEDMIIAKLEWALAGESERQLRDVSSIASVMGDKLDLEYIERWVAVLGLGALWSRARSQ